MTIDCKKHYFRAIPSIARGFKKEISLDLVLELLGWLSAGQMSVATSK